MKAVDAKHFHQLYGVRKPRINYHKGDFIDYVLMILVSASAVLLAYGPGHPLSLLGLALCAWMIVAFLIRHGAGVAMPIILRRPQDVLYVVAYKLQNVKLVYVIALGLLLLENYLIALTPNLPHHVELMRQIAIYAFYLHFIVITLYRTASLVDHLRKRGIVREVLLQSSWRSVISRQPNIALEIVHAYLTGVLTHVILIAPWYLVITHFKFSILFLPVVCVLNFITQAKFLEVINAWFYRDHWLGHNSELEFLYLHGTHHDAIPSGLIGVAGNGLLEGFLRNVLAYPTPFFNPVMACIAYSIDVQRDILFHQYIPGIFPSMSREFREVCQHSTHHFGRLEPYGFAIKLDQPGFSPAFRQAFKALPEALRNSAAVDEQLTGFEWDNPRHRWYLELCRKYQSKAQ